MMGIPTLRGARLFRRPGELLLNLPTELRTVIPGTSRPLMRVASLTGHHLSLPQ